MRCPEPVVCFSKALTNPPPPITGKMFDLGSRPQVPSFRDAGQHPLGQRKSLPNMGLKRRLFLSHGDPMRFLSQRVSTTVEMPLAHPVSTTTSSNFGPEPFLVVKFITADPGEAFADFSHRTEHPGKRNGVNEVPGSTRPS